MRKALWLLASVGAQGLAIPAVAQTAEQPADQAQSADQGDSGEAQAIVVTGSRIDRAGFTAPTPTVVVTAATLENRAAVNVADVINEIPSFRRTQSPESGGIGNPGGNNIDLRGLTPVRTLVLLDRMRLPPVNQPGSTVAGATDLNVIPTALIGSIDVVSGGASAAYGSDAVAGVVNLKLNTGLEGFKFNIQGGQTRYSDAEDFFVSAAFGTKFADGRGRFILGGEVSINDGTALFNDKRPWGLRNVSTVTFGAGRAAGLPANLVTDNVLFGTLTPGGLITPTAAGNPAGLRNLQFVIGPNGQPTTAPFNAGLYQGQIGTNMVGGTNVLPYQVLRAATQRYNLVGNLEFDFSDNVTAWVRGIYAETEAENISAQIRAATGGTTGFLSLSRNNPYLQAALTPAQLALIPANGSLTIGYLGNDFGPPRIKNEGRLYSFAGGLKGTIGSNWRWDATLAYGRNRSEQLQSNTAITANFLNAVNAVSLNGQIVCANAAARAAGCQPINILGRASFSPEAYAYAFGTSDAVAITTLFEAAANVNGEAFSIWAGPVSLGAGVEYREESFLTRVDPISQAGGFMARAPRDFPKAEQSVKEAYLEAIVPLLSEDWFTGALDLNGAVRLTDYSTSGSVTTWKAGLTWKPIPDILLRGTLSRDIRAPSLPELFTAAVQTVPRPLYADLRPAFAGQPQYQYDVVTGGNVNLKPEIARTTTLGAVFNPRFLSRLQFSVDYYQIKIREAIGANAAASVLTNCLGTGVGDPANPFCQLITFANNNITTGAVQSVVAQNANFAQFRTKGLDFGLSYTQPLSDFAASLPGRLVFSAQATHVIEYRSSFDISPLFPNGVNRAGQTGALFGGSPGLPDWAVNANLGYRDSRFEANVQYRWISRSRQNNAQVGPDDPAYSPALVNSISNNIIPAVGYVNIGASYNFGKEGTKQQLYFVVNNLFNKAPPLPAINNNAWYDLLGLSYRVGVRFEF